MSVWSALTALQGFIYDGPAGRIGFRPVLNPENHSSFFTTAEGYGLFTQAQQGNQLKASLDLREGQVHLTEVVLATVEGKRPKSVQVVLAGTSIQTRFDLKDGDVNVQLQRSLVLKAKQTLKVQVEFV